MIRGFIMNFDFNAHLKRLQDLLMPYEEIWSQELIKTPRRPLAPYPSEWLEDLANLSHHQLWQLDSHKAMAPLKSSLSSFLRELHQACRLPKLISQSRPCKINHKSLWGIKAKKVHELQQIDSLFKEYKIETDHLIDIGSGQGHLARVLSEGQNLKKITCLEANSHFITLGRKNLRKSHSASPITFQECFFNDPQLLDPLLEGVHSPLLMGLHTCGGLAVKVLASLGRHKNLRVLSLGCCYHKLKNESEWNLSGQLTLALTPYALTLASRGHGAMSYHDFCFKEKVKLYRYGLHFGLKELNKAHEFIPVGDSPQRHYLGSFEAYLCHQRQRHPDLLSVDGIKAMNHWFLLPKTQDYLRASFMANIIRWQMGRALEQCLLADRVLWLKDQGRELVWGELFDQDISPRNIALLSLTTS